MSATGLYFGLPGRAYSQVSLDQVGAMRLSASKWECGRSNAPLLLEAAKRRVLSSFLLCSTLLDSFYKILS